MANWFCLDAWSAATLDFPATLSRANPKVVGYTPVPNFIVHCIYCSEWLVPMWLITATAVVLSILKLICMSRCELQRAFSPRKAAESSR